jgi:hypothetical protein
VRRRSVPGGTREKALSPVTSRCSSLCSTRRPNRHEDHDGFGAEFSLLSRGRLHIWLRSCDIASIFNVTQDGCWFHLPFQLRTGQPFCAILQVNPPGPDQFQRPNRDE